MQKKKNKKIVKLIPRVYFFSRINLPKKLYWFKRLKFRIKKLNYKVWPFLRKSSKPTISFLYSSRITIRITSNNVYCTLVNTATNKIIFAASAGTLRVKTSVKLLKKYSLNRILSIFFKRVRKLLPPRGGLLVFLTVPIKSRKKVLNHIKKIRTYRLSNNPRLSKIIPTRKNAHLKEKVQRGSRRILIKFLSKKIFNGCRVKKAKRKKKNRKLPG